MHIDDSEIMTHILSKLPEKYETIVEILEDKLVDKDKSHNIERIRNKLSSKFD